MAKDENPRQKFIDVAYKLFSERGFYGVSLNDVAKEIGVSKQAIIYHFRTKEALYAAVLGKMAGHFDEVVGRVRAQGGTGVARLEAVLGALHRHMQECPEDARLIMRELLDNPDRAKTSQKWFLRGFLDDMVEVMRETPLYAGQSDGAVASAAYQAIGAINYFAISDATLVGVWGEGRLAGMKEGFLAALVAREGRDS